LHDHDWVEVFTCQSIELCHSCDDRWIEVDQPLVAGAGRRTVGNCLSDLRAELVPWIL